MFVFVFYRMKPVDCYPVPPCMGVFIFIHTCLFKHAECFRDILIVKEARTSADCIARFE